MADDLEITEVPPVISVTFKPAELPPGAIDLDDFAQFLDGLQLALEGVAQYDTALGVLDESGSRPRLTIMHIRESSVICDVIVNILSNDTLVISTPSLIGAAATTGVVGTAYVFREAIKTAVQQASADALKDGIEKATQVAIKRTSHLAQHLVSSLKSATGASPESSPLPSDLTLNMLPGLRKMAKVGAKQVYGEEGVTLTTDGKPKPDIRFNADAQRHIEEIAKEALSSSELVEMVGTIEDPSRRKRRFVLDVPGRPKRDRYVPCYYERQHEDLIRELYRTRDFVRVRGEKKYRLYANTAKPRAIINVTSIEPTRPEGLWAQSSAS